jgi:predicted amidophosphoribosyltransferase
VRALRATLPPDELHGDWVLRGLRADARAEHPELPACPSCGSSWNPADYRRDAEPIFCSHCKSELRRPA